jgi:hypothetical protein
MRDTILPHDRGALCQAGRDVVREVAVDSWQDFHAIMDSTYASKEVDGTFETSGKDSSTGEKEVSYTG